MADNTPLRFGLIGYGLFGRHHAASIEAIEGAELAGIAVRSEESQQAAKQEHGGAEVCGDYHELLGRDDIDAVNIVVPNQMHYEVAKAALEAGKHILLEKPMALRVDHCDELIELARQRGLKIAIGHELRMSTLWGGARELIDRGEVGTPQYCLVELSRFPYRGGSAGWRYDIERVGSWVLEEPVHFFDMARWYMNPTGEAESVYARANSRHPENPELQDNFTATMNFPNNGYAVVSQTLAAFGHHVSAKVSGTEGAIWAWWSAADARSDEPSFALQYGLGDRIEQVEFPESTGEVVELRQQIEKFARCLQGDGEPAADGVDGRWSTLLCLAAEESIRAGEIVDLKQFAGR